MKLSNSGLNKYLECARAFKLHYRKRLRSVYKSSALLFGGAIDQGLNEILTGKGVEAAQQAFLGHWTTGTDNAGKNFEVRLSPFITYSDSDFDFDLLKREDFALIGSNYDNTQPNISSNIFDIINYVKDQKKALGGVSQIDKVILSHYNLINWCVLKNKGQMMMQAYADQVMPLFKRVIDVQRDVTLDSNCGDAIGGIIDLVVELQDGSIAIIDNKTAAWDYDEDSVKTSQQLTIYKIILNNLYNDGKNEYKVDKCGYAVIKKKPIKTVTKVCKECGHEGQGKHETCDNTPLDDKGKPIKAQRCNGEWDKQIFFSFETQFIVDEINENQEDIVFETINIATDMINKEIFLPNMNSCIGKFGKCVYFDLCHNGSMEALTEVEDKKNEQNKETK